MDGECRAVNRGEYSPSGAILVVVVTMHRVVVVVVVTLNGGCGVKLDELYKARDEGRQWSSFLLRVFRASTREQER